LRRRDDSVCFADRGRSFVGRGSDRQYHDARKPGAGGRTSCRRINGGDGEHSRSPGTRTRARGGGSRSEQGSTDSAPAGDAVHSRGVCSFLFHGRSLALALRAAFAGGRDRRVRRPTVCENGLPELLWAFLARVDLLFAAKAVGAQFSAHFDNFRQHSVAVAHTGPRARKPAETLANRARQLSVTGHAKSLSLRIASRGSPVRSRSRPPFFSASCEQHSSVHSPHCSGNCRDPLTFFCDFRISAAL
jgi:hypothetical protein